MLHVHHRRSLHLKNEHRLRVLLFLVFLRGDLFKLLFVLVKEFEIYLRSIDQTVLHIKDHADSRIFRMLPTLDLKPVQMLVEQRNLIVCVVFAHFGFYAYADDLRGRRVFEKTYCHGDFLCLALFEWQIVYYLHVFFLQFFYSL